MKTALIASGLASVLVLGLAGCGQDESAPLAKPAEIKTVAQATELNGTVSDNQSLVKAGIVTAVTENKQEIARSEVANGHYVLEIPQGTMLPLLLHVKTEAGETFTSVVIDTNVRQYPINPLTTAIAKAAKEMGGYTRRNLIRAAEDKVNVPEANKTSSGWRGDPTTQYGGWH